MVIGSSLHFPCNTQHTVIFISLSLLWNGVWRPTFFWVNHESITTLSGCLKLIDTLRVNHWGEIGRSQLVYKFQPGQYVNGLWTMDWEAAGLAKRTLLTNKQRECQLAWALANKNWTWYQWQRVLFSEESKFDVGNHSRNSFVRRRPGKEWKPECIDPTLKHLGSVWWRISRGMSENHEWWEIIRNSAICLPFHLDCPSPNILIKYPTGIFTLKLNPGIMLQVSKLGEVKI